MIPSKQLIKNISFAFTILLIVNWVLLISVSGTIHGRYDDYLSLIDSKYGGLTISFMTIGCVQAVISIFGIIALAKENRWMITIYSVLLFIVLFLQIVGGVIALLYKNKVYDLTAAALEKAVRKYDYNITSQRTFIHWVQVNYKCCGVNGPADYKLANVTLGQCFDNNPVACHENFQCGKELYTSGCVEDLTKFLQLHLFILEIVALTLGPFVQLINFMLTCYLSVLIRRSSYTTGNWK